MNNLELNLLALPPAPLILIQTSRAELLIYKRLQPYLLALSKAVVHGGPAL